MHKEISAWYINLGGFQVNTVRPSLFLEAAYASKDPQHLAAVLRFFSDFIPGFNSSSDHQTYHRIVAEMNSWIAPELMWKIVTQNPKPVVENEKVLVPCSMVAFPFFVRSFWPLLFIDKACKVVKSRSCTCSPLVQSGFGVLFLRIFWLVTELRSSFNWKIASPVINQYNLYKYSLLASINFYGLVWPWLVMWLKHSYC